MPSAKSTNKNYSKEQKQRTNRVLTAQRTSTQSLALQ